MIQTQSAKKITTLAASGVVVEIDRNRVVEGFSAQLNGGECVGLLGANGVGKSSLLRVLAAVEQPAAGIVLLNDGPLREYTDKQRARQIAYMAQQRYCPWPILVSELVALGRLPQRARWAKISDEDMQAIDSAMLRCEVQSLHDRPVNTLSGGELARVLLARTLAVGADCLLVDEPTAGLDPAHQLQVMSVLKQEAQNGTAVLAVIHDLSLAAQYCDRIWLLHDQGLLASGQPDEVLSDNNLALAYGVKVSRSDHAITATQRLEHG